MNILFSVGQFLTRMLVFNFVVFEVRINWLLISFVFSFATIIFDLDFSAVIFFLLL